MDERNLARTIELMDLCFKLKEANLRRQHPGASPEEIRDLINRGILARKEQTWALPEICKETCTAILPVSPGLTRNPGNA
jgi:hypothetical protein